MADLFLPFLLCMDSDCKLKLKLQINCDIIKAVNWFVVKIVLNRWLVKKMVFISYSWDSDKHIERIKNFVTYLQENRVAVKWDGDMPLGSRITAFMESTISSCEYVLFICTPEYKRKADTREGGVGYESNIISGDLYNKYNELKYIPVLFEGDWDVSVPNWARGKLGIDLRFGKKSEYERLLMTLRNENKVVKGTSIEETIISKEGIRKAIVEYVLNAKLSLIRLVDKINHDSDLGDTVEKLQKNVRDIYVLYASYDTFLPDQEIEKLTCIVDTWNKFVPVYNATSEVFGRRKESKEEEKKLLQLEAVWNIYHKKLLEYCNEVLRLYN